MWSHSQAALSSFDLKSPHNFFENKNSPPNPDCVCHSLLLSTYIDLCFVTFRMTVDLIRPKIFIIRLLLSAPLSVLQWFLISRNWTPTQIVIQTVLNLVLYLIDFYFFYCFLCFEFQTILTITFSLEINQKLGIYTQTTIRALCCRFSKQIRKNSQITWGQMSLKF